MSGTRWTIEQLEKHPQRDKLLNDARNEQPKPVARPSVPSCAPPVPPCPVKLFGSQKFTVPGPAMGKPRMTQRDVWQKRPAVVRYREYCDRIRAALAAGGGLTGSPIMMIVFAYIAVKPSWSEKKKQAMIGKPHRQRPDADNIFKSVGDASLKEDGCLAGEFCWKTWCAEGDERTEIEVLYHDDN